MGIRLEDLKCYHGKVRDVYDVGLDRLLIVSSDRISAFDFVLPSLIPSKGEILNQISLFWFEKTKHIIKNHLISADIEEINNLTGLALCDDYYKKRTLLSCKAKRIDFECIVRGYISGSAWKEYQKTGSVCGIKLGSGLMEAQKFYEPIFTPSIKADKGHDENVSFDIMVSKIGKELALNLKEKSLKLYSFAAEYLMNKGIILADTKFEFGFVDGELILIDEVFTPDCSRFWDGKTYIMGKNPQSYDKQFVRDWLFSSGWDLKTPPPPVLPQDIIKATIEKYEEIKRKITE